MIALSSCLEHVDLKLAQVHYFISITYSDFFGFQRLIRSSFLGCSLISVGGDSLISGRCLRKFFTLISCKEPDDFHSYFLVTFTLENTNITWVLVLSVHEGEKEKWWKCETILTSFSRRRFSYHKVQFATAFICITWASLRYVCFNTEWKYDKVTASVLLRRSGIW